MESDKGSMMEIAAMEHDAARKIKRTLRREMASSPIVPQPVDEPALMVHRHPERDPLLQGQQKGEK